MKKMMLLAALLAMLVVAAIPAIAQVEQGFEQETDSGDLEQSSEQSLDGDNSIQCVNDQLNGNTGNLQTQAGGISYQGGDASPSADNSLTINEDQEIEYSCTADVNQAASAG